MEKRAALNKEAFEPPMPPVDPNGAPPMDPAMAGGAPPMDPAMAPPPPMDPAMAGGAPPQVDPALLQQALQDPNVQAMLAEIGITVDPQRGPIDQATGQLVPPEQMMMILQELMMQAQGGGAPGAPPVDPNGAPPMDPAMAGGAPPMAPPMPKMSADMGMAPMPSADPTMMDPSAGAMPPPAPPMPETGGGDIETRLTALEEQVGEMAAKMETDPDATQAVAEEGLSDEAQQEVLGPSTLAEEGGEKLAEDCGASEETLKDPSDVKDDKTEESEDTELPDNGDKDDGDKDIPKKASLRKEDPARRLSKLINRIRG